MDPIVQPNALPISVSIPGGLNPNRFIVIDGKIPMSDVNFSVRLQCGPQVISELPDVAMWLTVAFMQKKPYFSVNYMLDRKLGSPEGTLKENVSGEVEILHDDAGTTHKKTEHNLSLCHGDYCGVLLECLENCFSINVKSEHIHDFQHRIDYKRITYLVLTGDFSVVQAGVRGGKGPTRWLIYATGLYEPWQQTFVTVLNDTIFERAVINSKDLWLVIFYLNNCTFHSELENAATVLHERRVDVNIGVIDCLVSLDTVLHLEIEQCPTVLFFLQGSKTWSSAQKYDGEYTKDGFLNWAINKVHRTDVQPSGHNSPEHPTTSIRMVERDSWKKGPSKLLDGAGAPAEISLDNEFSFSEPLSVRFSSWPGSDWESELPDSNKSRHIGAGTNNYKKEEVNESICKNKQEALVKKWLRDLKELEKSGVTHERLKEIVEKNISDISQRENVLKLKASLDTLVLKNPDDSDMSREADIVYGAARNNDHMERGNRVQFKFN